MYSTHVNSSRLAEMWSLNRYWDAAIVLDQSIYLIGD